MIEIKFGDKFDKPIAVALGYFDCMHRGHVALVKNVLSLAQKLGAIPAVFTFDNNHFSVLGSSALPIYTFSERLTLYEENGLAAVVSAHFDKVFMSMTAETFLTKLFAYNVAGVVCGFDYTCGCDRKDCNFVSAFAASKGAECVVVDAVRSVENGRKISSSMIRELLLQGDVESAAKYTSCNYFVEGVVTSGRHVGAAIGFPTANIEIGRDKLVPHGVFGGRVDLGGKTYKTIINVGGKPTFNENSETIEVHVIGFSGDLYGKKIRAYFERYLRPIVKFDSVEALESQLAKDVERVK